MDQFAGVFLHMDTGDTDAFGLAVDFDIEVAVLADRQVVLRSLEVFRQVRIIVVFAVEFAVRGNRAVQGDAGSDREFQHFFVQHRQHAGQAETHRANVRVLLAAELSGAAAKNLGSGFQLRMNFQADDCSKFHVQSTSRIDAICLW